MVKQVKDKKGQVQTPYWIVNKILTEIGYANGVANGEILNWHIIDNSCGEGAFLTEIVRLICAAGNIHFKSKRLVLTKEVLETYVHGIEIDAASHKKCIEALNKAALGWGIKKVNWDVRLADALGCHDYDGKMDFVVGNPPYVRVHNLVSDFIKDYKFAHGGMTDLYLAFFELGFNMLKPDGKLAYISPSSWFTSNAGRHLREYILQKHNLRRVFDFGHVQVFDGVQTYTAIACFDNGFRSNAVNYTKQLQGDWGTVSTIDYQDFVIDGRFYFATKYQTDQLRDMLTFYDNLPKEKKVFEVKNGFATLADKIFVTEGTVSSHINEKPGLSQALICAIKASSGKIYHCIFPYNLDGTVMTEDELREKSPAEYQWLAENKERLLKRSTTEPWYAYGRTQAIKDAFKVKYPISSIIKLDCPVKVGTSPHGTGVFGGLYVLPKISGINWHDINEALTSSYFYYFVEMLGKYKSGGYYSFSSKDAEMYLNWKYYKEKGEV